MRGDRTVDVNVCLWSLCKDDSGLWEAGAGHLGLNKEAVLHTEPLASAGLSWEPAWLSPQPWSAQMACVTLARAHTAPGPQSPHLCRAGLGAVISERPHNKTPHTWSCNVMSCPSGESGCTTRNMVTWEIKVWAGDSQNYNAGEVQGPRGR